MEVLAIATVVIVLQYTSIPFKLTQCYILDISQ